ncbi:MAG: LamG domain-containing protein [Phycisphaerae bacterium]|nr:LamG domain-containing protein [Phycisphaerae bacterium]
MKRFYSYPAICALVFYSAVQATEVVWQYPCELTHVSKPECDCWTGLNENGKWETEEHFPVYVDPEHYLAGDPPSDKSAVTITTDQWIEVGFAGEITDGPDADVIIREMGRMGETALILLSDGRTRTYPLGIATAHYDPMGPMSQESTICEFDLKDVQPGFSPRAVRILSLGLGGASPGFDVGSVKARITVQSPSPYLPRPGHKVTDVQPNASLSWTGSGQASAVHLYLGQDLSAVNPDESDPFASLPGDVNVFVPSEHWALGQTYYWRVVEIVSSGHSPGNIGEVWQFQVNPHHVIDNFDQYNDEASFRDDWWATYYATRSLIHCQDSTYKGCHAAKLKYNLTGSDYAEYMHVKESGRGEMDWNQPGATTLELYFRSLPDEAALPNLYVRVEDLAREQMFVLYTDDPNHLNDGLWHPWRIDLSEFDNLELDRIASISIGVQFPDSGSNTPTSGSLFIDEIQLCGPRHLSDLPLETDLNQDQAVTTADLALFAAEWLSTSREVLTVQEPNAPWCHLAFDGSISDMQGNAQTSSSGDVQFDDHADFNGSEASIKITNAQTLTQFTQGITISFWQYGEHSIHRADTLVCSDYAYPAQAPELAIGLGLWEHPESLFWQCGLRQNPGNLLTGIHQVPEQWSQRWNHWAFAKDFITGRMSVYLNGRLLARGQGQGSGLTNLNTLELGNGWYTYYDGSLDDFRIHDYALNTQECAYLATNGTGEVPQPALMPSDFNQDGRVDWQDYAVLAGEWVNSK